MAGQHRDPLARQGIGHTLDNRRPVASEQFPAYHQRHRCRRIRHQSAQAMSRRQRQLDAGRAATDHHQLRLPRLRAGLDIPLPADNEGLQRPDRQQAGAGVGKTGGIDQGADVEREHVVAQVAVAGRADRLLTGIDAGHAVAQQSDTRRHRQRPEFGSALIERVMTGHPAGHHAGIHLPGIRRDQDHLDVRPRPGGQLLEDMQVGVAATGEDQALHGCLARSGISA